MGSFLMQTVPFYSGLHLTWLVVLGVFLNSDEKIAICMKLQKSFLPKILCRVNKIFDFQYPYVCL